MHYKCCLFRLQIAVNCCVTWSFCSHFYHWRIDPSNTGNFCRLQKAQKYWYKCFRGSEIYLRLWDRIYTVSRIYLKALRVFELIFTCISFSLKCRNPVPKYRCRMTRFRKVQKYRNRMTRFQVPNTDTAGTKKSTESQLCRPVFYDQALWRLTTDRNVDF